MNNDEAERLAIAIIGQACVDYRLALVRIRHNEDREKAVQKIMKSTKGWTPEEAEKIRLERLRAERAKTESIERFFHGIWFSRLCGINPDYLISGIRRIAKEQPETGRGISLKKKRLRLW